MNMVDSSSSLAAALGFDTSPSPSQPDREPTDPMLFGLYLNGETRNLPSYKAPEPNTQEENKFIHALRLWAQSSRQFPWKTATELTKMALGQNQARVHTSLLETPPGTILYRGMSGASLPQLLESMVQKVEYDKVILAPTKPGVTVSTPSTRGHNLQSWTSSRSKAMWFSASNGSHGIGWAVLVTMASPPNVFFLNPTVNALDQIATRNLKEYEAISVGPVQVDHVLYYLPSSHKTKPPGSRTATKALADYLGPDPMKKAKKAKT